jgi:hypothetical protein
VLSLPSLAVNVRLLSPAALWCRPSARCSRRDPARVSALWGWRTHLCRRVETDRSLSSVLGSEEAGQA